MLDDFVWTEKYRPKTIDETILPKALKTTFKEFLKQGDIPNMLLCGTAGLGKTTVAKALCNELNSDYIVINGSMNGNIDTLRVEIMNFASSVSFSGGRKYVILDEADYLNAKSTQPALRNFMEEYSKNCGFILTCNFKNRIIEPLHSRCTVIDFKIQSKDKASIAMQFFKRVLEILDKEHVEYNKKVVAEVVQKHFPDWRRVLNELQMYASTGKIDANILIDLNEESFDALMQMLKKKKFEDVRKWVAENNDMDSSVFFRKIYDTSVKYIESKSIPGVVVTLAKYQYQHAFVSDPEINIMAFLTEIMIEAEFK